MKLLKINELISMEERVSNFIYHAENKPSLQREPEIERKKIVAECTIKFMCYAGISQNGISEMVEKELGVGGLTKLKATHPVKYDGTFPRYVLNQKETYANVSDVSLKRAGKNTLEGASRDMITVAERAEQDAIRANPPVNCKGYVERSDYPLSALYSDYKDIIEETTNMFLLRLETFGNAAWSTVGDVVTWEDYRAERKKWRKCRHMFCLNMFPVEKNFKELPTKRKDSRYCCDDCRVARKDAQKRFDESGSYLPVYYYLPRLSESALDDIRKHEGAQPLRTIQKQKDKNKPVRRAIIKREKIEGGPMATYKTLSEALAAYAKEDRSGWWKIN